MEFFDLVRGAWLVLYVLTTAVYSWRAKRGNLPVYLRNLAFILLVWMVGYWTLVLFNTV